MPGHVGVKGTEAGIPDYVRVHSSQIIPGIKVAL